MLLLALKFLKIFDRRLSNDLVFIMLGSIISGMLELFGIMLILPFVQVSMNPTSIYDNEILLYIYKFSGISSEIYMIYIVGALCGLSFIIKDIFMLFFQYFQFGMVTNWRNELSEKFMNTYISLNYKYHLRLSSSTIINTLTSTVSTAVNGFLLQFVFLISYSIVAVFLLGYMLLKFPEATLLTTTTLFFLILFQMYILKKANKQINKDSVTVREENLVNLKQGIEAIKETKMFLREEYFCDLFKYSNRKVTNNERKLNLVQFFPLYLTEIIIILSIIVMVCSTIYFNDSRESSFQGITILVAIAFRLTPVINRILTSYSQIRSSLESVNSLLKEYFRISSKTDILTKEPQMINFNKSISLKNVFFAYNDVDVLLNINLSIRKGDFVGIVGHSGSGKTTIVDILMGLLIPRSGELLIDGVIAKNKEIRNLRKIIGYVPQSPFIGDMSVSQNVAYGVPVDQIEEDKVKEALKHVGLLSFFLEKKEGLRFKLGEGGKTLSGGQKQRIAIARALYNQPEILVLDEATSALDVKSESEISETISNLKGKTTIIAIAHRLSTIRNSDSIILVNWGEIEDIDTFDNLVIKNSGFKKIVEMSKL